MKKHFRLLMAAFLFGSIALVSCNKDDDEDDDTVALGNPTIELVSEAGFISTDTTVIEGTQVSVKIDLAQTGGNLSYLMVNDDTLAENIAAATYTYTHTFTVTGTATYEYTVANVENKTATKSITITVQSAILNANIKMYAQAIDGSSYSSCASIDGTTYSLDTLLNNVNLQANVDFVYHYTSKAWMSSPFDAETYTGLEAWADLTTKNQTLYYGVVTADFDNVTASDIMNHAAFSGSATDYVEDVVVDDVIAFQTASGKKGLMKVVDLVPGYDLTDYIEVSIKVLP